MTRPAHTESARDGWPTVSVIIPAYNAAAFVAEAIESALGQEHKPAEIIVVNDGSTDGTAAIADRYAPAVRVISQPNRGLGNARNSGAAAATGDWIAFLDADDTWTPRKLGRQLPLVRPEVAVVYSDRTNFGVLDGLPVIQSAITPIREGDLFETLLLEGNMLTASSAIVDRAVFLAVGGFSEDPRIHGCEDWDLWIRLAEEHTILACREPLVGYRLHAASMSRNYARMNDARLLAVERGLALPRGRALPRALRRRIRSATFRTNGWDAARSKGVGSALASYSRSILYDPANWPAYVGLLRVALGRP